MTTATAFAVGQGLENEQEFIDLPVGTVIGPDSGEMYRKEPGGEWYHFDGEEINFHYEGGFALNGFNKILQLGDAVTLAPPEPFALYRWRFLDYVWHNVEANGVSGTHVVPSLKRLGCEDLTPVVGTPVTSARTISLLPSGTLIAAGDPDDFFGYGLFGKIDSNLRPLLGGRNSWPGSGRVVQVGEVTDPPAYDPVVDPTQIAGFKARAWVERVKVKQVSGWCPTFDRIMSRFGITEAVAAPPMVVPFGPGMSVTRAEAATMPVGTLFGWGSDADNFVWFQRVNGLTTIAQTRLVLGRRGIRLGQSMARMHVLAVRNTAGFFSSTPPFGRDRWFWDLLPPGTTLELHENRYVMGLNRRVSREDELPVRVAQYRRGIHSFEEFTGPWTIVSFPTGEET